MDKIIFWFRQDLRLSDNPGLFEACQNGLVMPIYIFDNQTDKAFKIGAASQWWLHHSLSRLNESLENNLNCYLGSAPLLLLKLIKEHNVRAVYWNRCYEPDRIVEDAAIKKHLKTIGIECKSFNASLLWEPWEILKQDKTPYKIFTPFYRNGCLQAMSPRQPLPEPKNRVLFKDKNALQRISMLGLLPKINWHKDMEACWKIGEAQAQARLNTFLEEKLNGYQEGRNFPAQEQVSRLSPYLHFGEISPNQVWFSVQSSEVIQTVPFNDSECFLSELGWREFSYYLLYHFPDLPRKNFQKKFDSFPWQENLNHLKAWQRGKTGYPIIDAGMREFWETGYMHNRVRMIVGSFLVKNLLLHWHHGEDWFWDCLVDADLANNSASWQWVAGSGVDAAPYFRIFNPITQSEKFDPEGIYVRRFVPELARLPNKYLFKPWEAPDAVLKAAGVILGETYPKPIIDLKFSRERALESFEVCRHDPTP